ncbi:hypothetical protein WN944_014691 [Citrus x changshan-huyou]|uniref:Uncharacterized protein n=1 Tax=Citrus x changshan-huyou TaxID=2935761 RepID=A0AAP0MCJ8_9ROSI
MVGNGRESRGEQNPTGGVTQNRRKSRQSKVKQSQVSSFDRRRSGWFSEARMAGERRSASKLQIGTKLGQNGGQKWELWPGHVRGAIATSNNIARAVNIYGSPSTFPWGLNKFTAIGCDNYAINLDNDNDSAVPEYVGISQKPNYKYIRKISTKDISASLSSTGTGNGSVPEA